MDGLPSGTVTFLFTDVEDSSRLWDESPLQMRVALEQHDALLGAVIEAHGGYVFTTAGDSFAAAFQTADQAASAATEIQQVIADAEWDPATPVRVRIGLHTGEAHERGGDYFGPAVNRAARVEAAGHGGQVLTSGVTARVLGQSTTAVWELVDLGEHRLKGLSQPEHIHQLGAGDFLPVRAVPRATTNLRGESFRLIGRGEDVEAIQALLVAQRLVTVTGVGGVGKTSLATEVARQCLRSYNEVWFVELAGLDRVESVVPTVMRTIGIDLADADLAEIGSALSARGDVLLVLDNCEQVVEAVGDLVESLGVSPSVSILATSRTEILAPQEQVYRLAPLGRIDDAAELFRREARRRGVSEQSLDGWNAAIRSICQGVSAIPLAIELAAARTRSLDAAQILGQLEAILSSAEHRSRRDPRHTTMAATVDWSIDLLGRESQLALADAAAFAGTFDLEAAAAVLRVSDVRAAELLDGLVGHSLVETVRSDRGTRYRILGPVQQRARQLADWDEDAARDAHLDHYLQKVESSYEEFATSSCKPILDLLRDDFDNLRVAHRRALDSDRIRDDLRLYRPLAFTTWHAMYEVGAWALESLEVAEDTLGDVLAPAQMVALITTVMTSPTWTSAIAAPRVLELAGDLQRHLDHGGENEWATVGLAWLENISSGGRRYHERTGSFEPADFYLQFISDFFGSAGRFHAVHQDLAQLRAELDALIGKYRAVGADNLGTALVMHLAEWEVAIGDRQVGQDLSLQAEAAAREFGMGWVEKMAVLNQARASRAGVSGARPVSELLIDVLAGVRTTTGAAMGQLALSIAGEVLAEAGHEELARRAADAARDELRDGRAAVAVTEEVIPVLRSMSEPGL